MTIMEKIHFPYGLANFHAIITEGYYYVDRTAYIHTLENKGKTMLFLRPRRFGKSLLLSMLDNYYNVKTAAEFDRLFGHLAIGQNPTPLHNRYLILRWNFSVVLTFGDSERILQALYNQLNASVEKFIARYHDILDHDIVIHEDAIWTLQSLLAVVEKTPYKLYLLLDEYDSFANDVLMVNRADSHQRYTELVESDGMLKTVFRWVKAGLEEQIIERVFITGVSPVLAKDLTSGFNISESISLDENIADICGFYETEIAAVLTRLQAICGIPDEKTHDALDTMRTFYNGYRFTPKQPALLYNPTMVLYFLKQLQETCEFPERILDTNLSPDRGKIGYIANIPTGDQVIATAANDIDPLVIPNLADRFGIYDMLYGGKDAHYLISLLYYLGVLTLGERDSYGFLTLHVPNLAIRKIYVEQLADMLLPREAYHEVMPVAMHFYRTGDMATVCDFLERTYMRVFDNRDYRWANELTIKTMFLMLLFNDTLYIMDSEPAIGRTYGDLSMMLRSTMRRYDLCDFLMEFKYVSPKDVDMSGTDIGTMERETLAALKPVQHKLTEAQAQLARYRTTLQEKYGEQLRLRCFAIVAVGYERLVYVEAEGETQSSHTFAATLSPSGSRGLTENGDVRGNV